MPVRTADIPQHLATKLGIDVDNVKIVLLPKTPGVVKAEVRLPKGETDFVVDQYTGDCKETDFWRSPSADY